MYKKKYDFSLHTEVIGADLIGAGGENKVTFPKMRNKYNVPSAVSKIVLIRFCGSLHEEKDDSCTSSNF